MSGFDQQINLLPQRELRTVVREQRSVKTQVGLFVVLVLCAGVAIGIWFVVLMLSNTTKRLEVQAQELEQAVTSEVHKEQQLELLANRLKEASSIMTLRSDFGKEFDQSISALPQSISVLSADFQKDKKTVVLTVASQTFSGLQDMMTVLQSGGFSAVSVRTFRRDYKGEYTMEIVLTLP